MDKKDILKFELRLYEFLDTLLPGKIEIIKKYLPENVDDVFKDELQKIIEDLKDAAYEYKQFNKDLNAFLDFIDELKDENAFLDFIDD